MQFLGNRIIINWICHNLHAFVSVVGAGLVVGNALVRVRILNDCVVLNSRTVTARNVTFTTVYWLAETASCILLSEILLCWRGTPC